MATTMLGHIGGRSGSRQEHLIRSIYYIMNPKKTGGGIFVGSNCGRSAEEIHESMIRTKQFFEKAGGRQAYHFVISFPPGEADPATVYGLAKDFCREYLAGYDYVFAVHDDRHHLHAHIIFNSVSREDGCKYRYVNGDWEKNIQPIVDRLAEKYGLKRLTFDREMRKGKSYAQWLAEKHGYTTKSMLLRADIDAAVHRSRSFDEFKETMRTMGYRLREGVSEKHGRYIAYTFPEDVSDPGSDGRARRDYKLGTGYTAQDIRLRIERKLSIPEQVLPRFSYGKWKPSGPIQANFVERVVYCVTNKRYDGAVLNQAKVHRDILQLSRLYEQTAYLIDHELRTEGEIRRRMDELKAEEKLIRAGLYTEKDVRGIVGEEAWKDRERYWALKKEIKDPAITDEAFEAVQDEIEDLTVRYPDGFLDTTDAEAELYALRREKSILRRIIKETGTGNKEKKAELTDVVRQDVPVRESAGTTAIT